MSRAVVRRSWRRGTGMVAAAVATLGLVLAAPAPAWADEETWFTAESTIALEGLGFGHGRGMSQYGAKGAAERGLTVWQILDFYYPGTANVQRFEPVRVKVDDRTNGGTVVASGTVAAGLRVVDEGDGASWVLDRDPFFRVVRLPDGRGRLEVGGGGKPWWHVRDLVGTARFEALSGAVRLSFSNGTSTAYRGTVTAVSQPSGMVPVNTLPVEEYLRGVVPDEMPSSWHVQAVRAQAIAARSYTYYYKHHRSTSPLWDICSTTSCQVYGGIDAEEPAATHAVEATVGFVRTWQGALAQTEFSSSNGGWTTAGGPYMPARPDPYDPATPWSLALTTTSVERAWPQVGRARAIQVTQRDGNGTWGGRATSVTVLGSTGTATVTGDQFRTALGLRSTWFSPKVTGIQAKWFSLGGSAGQLGRTTSGEYSLAGGRAQDFERGRIHWAADRGAFAVKGAIHAAVDRNGGTVRLGLPQHDEFVVRAGVVAQGFDRGDAYWSSTTGAHPVTGGILARIRGLGGTSVTGLPRTDEVPLSGGALVQRFERRDVYWSSATGAHSVSPGVRPVYDAGGGYARYGLPLAEEAVVAGHPDTVAQTFQRGRSWWAARTGAGTQMTTGAIGATYLAAGGPGAWGLPTSGEALGAAAGTVVQYFERVVATWDAATGRVTTSPR